jgi:hypothetical protein
VRAHGVHQVWKEQQEWLKEKAAAELDEKKKVRFFCFFYLAVFAQASSSSSRKRALFRLGCLGWCRIVCFAVPETSIRAARFRGMAARARGL